MLSARECYEKCPIIRYDDLQVTSVIMPSGLFVKTTTCLIRMPVINYVLC